MAGNEIVRNIVLNGKVGNGFQAIGDTLMQMGAQIDGLSQRLINFGRESLDVYKDYQFNMAQARIAQATNYGKETEGLNQAMEQLETYAKQWSESTIFHVKDVSNAIMLASREGMDAQEIIASFPHMLELAQAGGIDLSEAVDMALRSMRALGYDFHEDIIDFVDLWAYSANSSAGSVESFGEAMLKLGSVMRFTESKEELFSLLALMHNMGATGSEAATLIRTSMMRIIAPSGVTSKVLKMLGATEEEVQGVMDDFSKTEAFKFLTEKGFSAYTKEGELKPILTIFRELGQVLSEEAGGFEKISKNQTTNGVLGAIFGTRGIVGATNIINALQYAMQLEEDLVNGAATGYGQYAQEIMMNTLFGSEELLGSKVEELQRRTGESLHTRVEEVHEQLGGIIDVLNNLDEGTFNALVSGLTGIAGLGGALTVTGLAVSFLGKILTPTGAAAMGLAAIVSAMAAINELEDFDFEQKFGTGELGQQEIMSYVNGIGQSFRDTWNEVDQFRVKIQKAGAEYEATSAKFSSSLITAMITGNTMTDEQRGQLETLGTDMYRYVVAGITEAQNASLAYWAMFFGDGETSDEKLVSDLIANGYEDMLSQAALINRNIKDILMKGFEEGFTDEDYQKIRAFMDEYNELVARASAESKAESDYVERQKLLHKAQSASLKDVDALSLEIQAQRDSVLAESDDQFWSEYFKLQYQWDKAIEEGRAVNGVAATPENRDAALAALEAEYQRKRKKMASEYDNIFALLWRPQLEQSDYANEYRELSALIDDVLMGRKTVGEAYGEFNYTGPFGMMQRGHAEGFRKAVALMMEPYGSGQEVLDAVKNYRRNNNPEAADTLLRMFMMDAFLNQGSNSIVNRNSGFAGWLLGDYSVSPDMNSNWLPGITEAVEGRYAGTGDMLSLIQQFWGLIDYVNTLDPTVPMDQFFLLFHGDMIEDELLSLQERIRQLWDESGAGGEGDEGLTAAVKAVLDVKDLTKTKLPELYGTAKYQIQLVGPSSGSSSFADDVFNGEYTSRGFASGGRATVPSIFGEAGAEWAIPEAHTQATAELLNAARQASGFTWPDLISRVGGLNADVRHTPTTIVYSPTITARDVSGVREALAEDKRRLERWYEDRKLRERVEAY